MFFTHVTVGYNKLFYKGSAMCVEQWGQGSVQYYSLLPQLGCFMTIPFPNNINISTNTSNNNYYCSVCSN